MCGVAAIFNYNSNNIVEQSELISIRDSMISRGPDSSGLWFDADKKVGLAHRRLAIIDLSTSGYQPMASFDNTIQIVFNGEIYNYQELQQHLKNKGYSFKSNSDTEVLIYLYKEYGHDMVKHLRGMFTFIIWDEIKQGLLLGRDHFGIKPLYFTDNGHTIRIASQVKALLKGNLAEINTDINPAGQVGFFIWGHIPEPYTLYKGIRTLPSGCTLWIDKSGSSKVEKYFNVTNTLVNCVNNPLNLSQSQISEKLREAISDSISHHLISDVPVGLFLSSGLDSSTILAHYSEISNNPIKTFTLGFKEFVGTDNDETILSRQIAKHYNAQYSEQFVTKDHFFQQLEHIYQVMDQPTIDGVNSYFVCKGAHEAGIKVALSGLGGDEIFAGYPDFYEIPKLANTLSMFNNIPWFGKTFRYISAPILKHFTSPKYASLFEYGSNINSAYLLRHGLFMPWELPKFMDGDIVRQGWHDLQTLNGLTNTISGINNTHLRITALDTSWYLRNQLLRDSDWASMAHSLELRVPFVDIELFKTVASLVSSGSKCSKQDMASTPKNSLPDIVLNRKKTGFYIPVNKWIQDSLDNKSNYQTRGLRGWATKIFINCRKQK